MEVSQVRLGSKWFAYHKEYTVKLILTATWQTGQVFA